MFFSQATKRMSPRQRPFHACGVSILAIVDIALGKTQDINGPLGSTLRKMAKLAKFVTPLIYAMQYQWLAILSFFDDRILSAEKMTEKLFPPSTYAFDQIDDVVLIIESLPDKFDEVMNKFPALIHQVPLLEWTMTHVISRLGFLALNWGEENSVVNEKTIGVDINCNSSDGINKKSESVESFPPLPEAENKEVIHDVAVSSTHMKGSYKEVLLESEKKIDEGEGGDKNVLFEKIIDYKLERSHGNRSDPLLELFENAWLMKGHY